MEVEASIFFSASLSAGAILTGFCGTFLSFRIQREAAYYRQPVVDFASKTGACVHLGLSHFTSAFFLLIVATLLAVSFGFVLPLLALAGVAVANWLVVGGMLAAVVFVVMYFFCELVHYQILSTKLLNDPQEWGEQSTIVIFAFAAGTLVFMLAARYI